MRLTRFFIGQGLQRRVLQDGELVRELRDHSGDVFECEYQHSLPSVHEQTGWQQHVLPDPQGSGRVQCNDQRVPLVRKTCDFFFLGSCIDGKRWWLAGSVVRGIGWRRPKTRVCRVCWIARTTA